MEQWNFDYYNDEYLAHHGIKGMQWGVRRFQRKDGSLTQAGQKRRTLRDMVHDHKVKKKRKVALEKARATKQANKEAEEKARKDAEKRQKLLEKGKIPASKMTTEEMQAAIARKQLEKQYKQIDLETNVTKRFMNNAWNNAVEPALLNAGKNVLQKYTEKAATDLLGLNKKKAKTATELLKEKADIARYKKEIADYEKQTKEIKDGKDASDQLYDTLKKQADIARYKKEIADYTKQEEKIKSGNSDSDDEAKILKREAEMAKNRKNAYADNRALNKMIEDDAKKQEKVEKGKKASDKVKSTILNTSVNDLESDVNIKKNITDGEGYVQTASGIWLSSTTYNSLK